jgi:hypothetical protein
MAYRLQLSVMTDEESQYGRIQATASEWDGNELVGSVTLWVGQMTMSGEAKEPNLLQWAIVNMANMYDVAAHHITKRFTDNEVVTMLDQRNPKLF